MRSNPCAAGTGLKDGRDDPSTLLADVGLVTRVPASGVGILAVRNMAVTIVHHSPMATQAITHEGPRCERHYETDGTDDHENHSNRVDVEPILSGTDRHCEVQNGAHREYDVRLTTAPPTIVSPFVYGQSAVTD